jgi:hypothetical protein
MNAISFDKYVTNIEGVNAFKHKKDAQLFASPTHATTLSGIQIADTSYTNKNDIRYNNPSLESKKNSIEFTFKPEKHSILNRLSVTLYQNKMKPHKKAMLPVMTNYGVN